MTLETVNNILTSGLPSPVPLAVIEKLAGRFRASGMCLMFIRPDGSLAYFDAAAGPFFSRYVVPLLAADSTSIVKLQSLPAEGLVVSVDSIPGAIITAARYSERRQPLGFIAIAGRSQSFALDEDVLRACNRVALDSVWLGQQAQLLCGCAHEIVAPQAMLVASMLRDQIRIAGMEIELNSLSEQLANTYEELSLSYQISSGMRVNRRANDFFRQTCHDVMEVMNVRAMGVVLNNPDGGTRNEPVIYGPLTLPEGVLPRLAGQVLPLLHTRKAPFLINDLGTDKAFGWLGIHAQRILAVPLQRQDQVLGGMFVLDKRGGDFDSVDSKLLNSIANESAIYLENANLFADVHGLMMGLLHSLTSAVDAKDAYTCGHSERVALLSRHLAIDMGFSDTEVERIYMAGLLHDVGKIGVPESVLQKTGRLTAEEFDQMKKHPQIGARILADVKQLKAIIPGVLHHHERYDGKGYPFNLAATTIPLMGRIICLADCFDAMTSSRTYRKALPLEVALSEIRRCSGTQFDPHLAEAFLRTGPDVLRELLANHAEKSKKLLDLQETLRTA